MTPDPASFPSGNSVDALPPELLQRLESWGSYEQTAQKRDLSKLHGIQTLLADLNHPERSYRVIHVAGTNGKGMVSVCMAALLQQAGFRTGCYLSPHLVDLRERVLVDGSWVAPQAFREAAERVLAVAEPYQGVPYLSYFDLMTAIALVAFAQAQVDWVVLETGLGGQADSTNAVEQKELCLLTSVGFDHEAVLGSTLSQIRREKFGIFRSGVPAILGMDAPYQGPFFRNRKVPLHSVRATLRNRKHWLTQWAAQTGAGSSAAGKNRLTALLAMDQLFPEASAAERAQWGERLQALQLPGRLQGFSNLTLNGHLWEQLLLDGGHNEQALQALSEAVSSFSGKPSGLLVGMAEDKLTPRTRDALGAVAEQVQWVWTVPIPSPRTASPEALAEALQPCSRQPVRSCASWEEAWAEATRQQVSHLVLCGSFYLVGAFLRAHPELVQTRWY